MPASPMAWTAELPLLPSATPASHSALYLGSNVATYSAWAAICWRMPWTCRFAPATAASQRVVDLQVDWASSAFSSATPNATRNSAHTAPNPAPSFLAIDHSFIRRIGDLSSERPRRRGRAGNPRVHRQPGLVTSRSVLDHPNGWSDRTRSRLPP